MIPLDPMKHNTQQRKCILDMKQHEQQANQKTESRAGPPVVPQFNSLALTGDEVLSPPW